MIGKITHVSSIFHFHQGQTAWEVRFWGTHRKLRCIVLMDKTEVYKCTYGAGHANKTKAVDAINSAIEYLNK